MTVRLVVGAERDAAIARLVAEWGDPVLARGSAYAFADCTIFIAGEMAGVAAVTLREPPTAELVAINAFVRRRGVGTALLEAVVAQCHGFASLRLSTTNDNLDALRFYQRRGFHLASLRPGAVTAARRLKPSIPLFGEHGIEIRDEIDLKLGLRRT
jgi:ribosomal protein S18 acetylase RimI-like enzyme